MNVILVSNGYLPAIIHAKERQLYYDALKTNDNALATVVRDALLASMESAIRYFEQVAPPQPEPEVAPRKPAKKAAGSRRR